MKIFITWSGSRSRYVAGHLKEWLEQVFQDLTAFMSDADIEAGEAWAAVIARELEESNFSVICLTPENISKPWVLFEAGAIAKHSGAMVKGGPKDSGARAVPYLIDMRPDRLVNHPLSAFQAKQADKDGTLGLVQTINKNGPKLAEAKLAKQFELCWPDLEAKLAKIPETSEVVPPEPTTTEVLSSLVVSIQQLHKKVDDLQDSRQGLASLLSDEDYDPPQGLVFPTSDDEKKT